ncbi:TatD family hydrolase [Paraburkholderia sp. UCT31]|uniref:TatD family hydrolase n=1 Tax=Paraburkholderia sp. UCT31 TaxID=2615209 RepID=UPI001655A216|nr:TatD family hydrolase [Paraburkholderia sp. UCT31]
MLDIGVNFHSPQLKGSTGPLLERAKSAGIRAILATGSSRAASQAAHELACQHAGYIWATAGVHPHGASHWDDQVHAALDALWRQPEVVAVGELGLDYNRLFSPRDAQRHAFEQQLAAAVQVGKPLFLHSRDAFEDFRAMTREAARAGARGVVHCFTGTAAEALAHLEDGYDIGVTGWVADPVRGESLRQALKVIPLERIHLETDAPYLMPRNKPKRGSVNEPANLPWVAKAVAELLDLPPEEVGATCEANSRRLFALPSAKR